MTTRTVKVLGWGVGSATLKATLDSKTVFDGQVDLEEMTAENESEQTAPTLFAFEIPMDYAGTMHMTVSVANAVVRFGQILANYKEVEMGSIMYSSGVDNYLDVAEYDADYVRDPRTNVTIDGMPQSADRALGKGTWHWVISPGSTLAHDLVVPKPGVLE
jgi:hypothetical protein